MTATMLDFIYGCIDAEQRGVITLDEFTDAMRSGDEIRIQEAVDRMNDAGGYENLE